MRVRPTPPVMIGDCRTTFFNTDKRLGNFMRCNLKFSLRRIVVVLLSDSGEGAYYIDDCFVRSGSSVASLRTTDID